MLDQSFSAENFEKIFDMGNRQGKIKKDFLPAEYMSAILNIKEQRKEIKRLRQEYRNENISKEDFKRDVKVVEDKIKEFIKTKEETLYTHLKKVSRAINAPNFKFIFNIGERRGKTTYELTKDDECQYYAIKQLQSNIRSTFNVKQADRAKSLQQIMLSLDNSLPKIIIRTDIESFYESIQQTELLSLIDNNTLLNFQSKKFVSSIIAEYELLREDREEKPRVGIPRGVGISAYLSELYMKDIDKHIKSMDGVVLYKRYVDDIFIVITPKSKTDDTQKYIDEIKNIVSKKGLRLNYNTPQKIDHLLSQ